MVKSELLIDDIVKIFNNYNLGEVLEYKPIKEGTVQTNVFVKTKDGGYILKYYENRVKESVLFEANLIKYLRNRKYPCPNVFKSREGNVVGLYKGKPYIIFEFIEGEHIENPSENQKKQLIKRIAELHNITKNYKPLYRSFRWNYSVELCRKLALERMEKLGTVNAKKKFEWLESELANLQIPKSLPKGICHCDFHFSNVIFKDGEFRALIDFDDANYTFLVYDLVIFCEPFIDCFRWDTWDKYKITDDVFDFKELKRVIFNYMKYRPLNDIEKRYLFDIYKLSILFDCIWYFQRGEAEDFYEKRKINYLNRLGRERFYSEIFR